MLPFVFHATETTVVNRGYGDCRVEECEKREGVRGVALSRIKTFNRKTLIKIHIISPSFFRDLSFAHGSPVPFQLHLLLLFSYSCSCFFVCCRQSFRFVFGFFLVRRFFFLLSNCLFAFCVNFFCPIPPAACEFDDGDGLHLHQPLPEPRALVIDIHICIALSFDDFSLLSFFG